MWVESYSLPKNQGITCEHCGTYICNVFVIHFDDGFSLKCGVECFNKLMKTSNLSQYGAKLLRKQIKRLKDYDEMRVKWEGWQTPEEADADGSGPRIEDPEKPGFWRLMTQKEFDEHKAFILTDLIPYRVALVQEEIKKQFKNVRVKHA